MGMVARRHVSPTFAEKKTSIGDSGHILACLMKAGIV